MGGGEATSLYSFSQGSGSKSDVFDDLAGCASSDYFDSEILRRRKLRVNEEIMQSNNNFRMRIGSFEEAKNQILSYVPGAWIEEVGGMKERDYDIPKTTTLLLLGPRGSGKSSLVNRISRIFEDSNFTSERAQVSSYNSTVGDGTHFLKEYMIPRDSTSFCLYDTPSLLENSCDNLEIIKNWLTVGVRHGEMVIRDSDTSSMRKTVKCKTQQADYYSKETRMVNFVIFVVDGPSVLKSMEGEDNAQYACLLVETFNCPYLSFKDDKPVVVITHGDLLSCSDRDHIRIHLGELLGIPPTKQIFDISEKNDPETDLTVLDMLRYSLEHADRNLSNKRLAQDMVHVKTSSKLRKRDEEVSFTPSLSIPAATTSHSLMNLQWTSIDKHVLRALIMMVLMCISLFSYLGIWYNWDVIQDYLCNSENLNWLVLQHLECRSNHINWHEIRHLWLG